MITLVLIMEGSPSLLTTQTMRVYPHTTCEGTPSQMLLDHVVGSSRSLDQDYTYKTQDYKKKLFTPHTKNISSQQKSFFYNNLLYRFCVITEIKRKRHTPDLSMLNVLLKRLVPCAAIWYLSGLYTPPDVSSSQHKNYFNSMKRRYCFGSKRRSI